MSRGINGKAQVSKKPTGLKIQDRLSFMGSTGSDSIFLGQCSLKEEVAYGSEGLRNSEASSSWRSRPKWVGFGQMPALGGVRSKQEVKKLSRIGERVEILVHMGRGALSLAAVLPERKVFGSEYLRNEVLQSEVAGSKPRFKDLNLMVGEALMGIPVGLVKKSDLYLLKVDFCQPNSGVQRSSMGLNGVKVTGYVPFPRRVRVVELAELLGRPRYFLCRGVVDGSLMLRCV